MHTRVGIAFPYSPYRMAGIDSFQQSSLNTSPKSLRTRRVEPMNDVCAPSLDEPVSWRRKAKMSDINPFSISLTRTAVAAEYVPVDAAAGVRE